MVIGCVTPTNGILLCDRHFLAVSFVFLAQLYCTSACAYAVLSCDDSGVLRYRQVVTVHVTVVIRTWVSYYFVDGAAAKERKKERRREVDRDIYSLTFQMSGPTAATLISANDIIAQISLFPKGKKPTRVTSKANPSWNRSIFSPRNTPGIVRGWSRSAPADVAAFEPQLHGNRRSMIRETTEKLTRSCMHTFSDGLLRRERVSCDTSTTGTSDDGSFRARCRGMTGRRVQIMKKRSKTRAQGRREPAVTRAWLDWLWKCVFHTYIFGK